MLRFLLLAAAAVPLFLTAHVPAAAQGFPARPVKIIVPYPAGGATDVVVRAAAVKAGEKLGQPVVIENRAGAGGTIGAQAVATAAADGYTLVAGNMPALSKVFVRNPPFDSDKDFVPVVPMFRSQYLLAINSAVPARNLKEFIDYARTQSGKLNYSSGLVTAMLPMELLKKAARFDISPIPYKGSTPAMLALRTNEIHSAFDNLGNLLPMQQQGVVRILAVAGDTRLPQISDVPTMGELGFPNIQAGGTVGLWAPAGTPKAVVDRLNEAFREGLAQPNVAARVAAEGAVMASGPADELLRRYRSEMASWAEMARAADYKPD